VTTNKRENCHSLHGRVLSFIERRDGRAGLAEVARRAGDDRPLDVLLDLTQWCSWDESRRLLEAAADYLGCPEVVREAAAFYDRENLPESSADTVAALQALGGPGGILTTIAEAASKFSAVIWMAPDEVQDLEGVVVARSVPGYPRYPMLCEVTAGLLRVSAELFGLPSASVEEECCECRGDPECRFRVAWAPAHDVRDSAAVDLAWLRARFASLRSTVADLVSGQDVEVVLERIVARAALACRGPRYLLAVRLTDNGPIRVHALGFSTSEAEVEAEVLLAEGHPVDLLSRLVLDVRSGDRCYGRLLARNPDGVGFLPEDELNLTAYAELAAVALDGATALVEARRSADTAEALLDLARALGEVTSIEDVASTLAAAVPRVVGADSAAVHRWDGTKLSIMAAVGMPAGLAAELDSFSVPLDAGAPLRVAIEHGEPYILDAASTRGQVRRICEASGIRAVALVPIRVGGELFGIVGAGVGVAPAAVRGDAQFVARLRGLASLAATAFENATLLDQIRHQSLHDPLTGMPNLRLLADRVEQALAAGRRSGRAVALAFVDVDGFKAINDTYGHAVGDEVLRRLAQRMRRSVRATDTVARVGGDEFVVLLPEVADTSAAQRVVEYVLTALREPLAMVDTEICVGASAGLAFGPADGEDFHTLLATADAVMYAHKRARSGDRPAGLKPRYPAQA